MDSKEKELEHIRYLLGKYDFEKRYKNLLIQIQDVLEALGILDKVEINCDLLGQAVLNYFEDVEIMGIPVESDVSEQPVNDEIYNGAKNRVKNLKKYAKENNIIADLYLSIESGINNSLGKWMITNIAVIEDNNNFESYGTSPSFPVPDRLVQDVIDTDLSQVMNNIFEKDEERHNKGGGIQLLTHNKISRIDLTEMAFIMALTKYINEDKWR